MLSRNLLIVVSSIAVMFTSGCGFKPLHSETLSASKSIESVKVAIIKDRAGQQLRNRLLDFMNPSGQTRDAQYQLEVVLTESDRELSFRKDLVARRKSMTLRANYQLRDINTNKIIFQKIAESHNSYSLGVSSDLAAFSSYALEQDSRVRMIEILAHEIKIQIANFLLHHLNGKEKFHENNASKIP